MSNYKFTGGKWTAHKQAGSGDIIVFDSTMQYGRICTMRRMPVYEENKAIKSDSETEANARLIAAAPDLLSALINLRNLSYDTARPTKAERNIAIGKAEAAIKKATGE